MSSPDHIILLLVVVQSDNVYVLSPVQTDTTLLANNSQHCWMLHVESVWTPCCMLLHVLGVVAQSLKPVKLSRASCKQKQQLPTSLGQQFWELLCPFAHSFTGQN